MALKQNPQKNLAWKRRQQEEDRLLANLVAQGRTASGRTFEETTALPKNAKTKYTDFLDKYRSIMNDSASEERKVEDILSARKDAYVARNYYAANQASYDQENGKGYSEGILKEIDARIAEMDAYQKRLLGKNIAAQQAESEKLYAIKKRREDAIKGAASTPTMPDNVKRYKERVDAAARESATEKLKQQMDVARQDPLTPYARMPKYQDFAEGSAAGASLKNPAPSNGLFDLSGLSIGGWKPFQAPIENKAHYYRDNPMQAIGETDGALYIAMNDNELDTYDYILSKDKKNGTDEATKYFEALRSQLNARVSDKAQGYYTQMATDDPVGASVLSVGSNLLSGAGYVKAGINAIAGKPIDQNDPSFVLSKMTSTIRQTVGENIKSAVGGGFGGDAAQFVYNGLASVADSLLTAGIAKGIGTAGKAVAGFIFGTNAGTSATVDALNRGATNEQAMWQGFFNGMAEVVFEEISLDRFIKMTDASAKKALLKNLLKQSGIEASEEAATEISNIITDALVMGDKNQINQLTQQYISDGMSEKDATIKTYASLMGNVALAAAGGAFSGGLMGGAATAISKISQQAPGAEAAPQDVLQQAAAEAVRPQFEDVSAEAVKQEKANVRASTPVSSKKASVSVPSEQGTNAQPASEQQAPAKATESAAIDTELSSTAKVLGDETGEKLVNSYAENDNLAPAEYASAYLDAYASGKKGESIEAVASDSPLRTNTIVEAYTEGKADAADQGITYDDDGYTSLTEEQKTRIREALNDPENNSYFIKQVQSTVEQESKGGSSKTVKAVKPGRYGNAVYSKWVGNEYVNIKPDTGDPREGKFKRFFEKYYNAGRNGTRTNEIPFDDTIDAEFPVFLQDVFYRAGVMDTTAKQNKTTAQKPVASENKTADAKPVKSTEKSGTVVYPSEKNGLPYDVVIEKLDTSKYAQTQDNAQYKTDSISTKTTSTQLSETLLTKWIAKGTAFNSSVLFEQADKAFGGTQGQGTYTPKDAYDAMELAVNKHLLDMAKTMNGDGLATAKTALNRLINLLSKLPTQTKRSEEQESFQQFSTPPNIAYLAARAANITNADQVLEPSAGIGGLAVFAKAWGAKVFANELSERRVAILKEMGFDRVFNENAEQIDNLLPDDVKPSVVLMNPPFSSTAGRTSKNSTHNAETHVEQALRRLSDGGRLVAVLGKGMADDAASFSGWWKTIRQNYTIRANIGIDGSNYTKYGTGWGVQIVVIDKTGAQGDVKTITGTYKDLNDVAAALEGVRNERDLSGNYQAKRNSAVAASQEPIGQPAGNGAVPDARDNASASGVGEGRVPQRVRAGVGRGDGNAVRDVRGAGSDNSVDTRVSSEPAVRSGDNRGAGQRTSGTGNVAGASEYSSGESELSLRTDAEQDQRVEPVSDDGVYAEYISAQMPVTGAKKHPAPLVESAAMAAVNAPKATYVPNLPAKLIKDGLISSAQLENIVYAGQAHSQKLENGQRKGYFIGDGTGVGKGRQISGIILDNFRNGRKKAVWVSKNMDLLPDAQRDWVDIGGSSEDVISQSKFKPSEPISMKSGILFTGYSTVSSKSQTTSRLKQLVEWLGKDFDGVIAFDEVHTMGNLLGKGGGRGKTKGSAIASAGAELQDMLPNARVLYVSATGATDVDELSFASRLGLWGEGSAFKTLTDFVEKIGASGLSAMELVARDMKAAGSYLARSISYAGVEYDTLQHDLTTMQREIYDSMSDAWQVTLQNMNEALNITGQSKDGNARGRARSAYFGAMQRFYNQILTSMSMPSVIGDIKKQLASGNSCVLQIVNTNAAEMERQLSKAKDEGSDLENLDLTPRGTLIEYLKNAFPVNVFQEVEDENGKKRNVPVIKDGKPLVDKKAERIRDELVNKIEQMKIPDGPLEMLFDAFGEDQVAEVTGRSRRVVTKKDGSGKTTRVEEPRSRRAALADAEAFQNGDKRILIFSDAGGTGKSYHADLRAKNQQKRIHYLVQAGWSASKAVQGFGRTHRSNQKQPPLFKLVTTDVMGQKRFVSTIARRLDQLGALTKGQRDTGGGMFNAKDNLESPLAKDSLYNFYTNLGNNRIPGLNGKTIIKKMGLYEKFYDEYNRFKPSEDSSRDMNTFLNRILALTVDEQNAVFSGFFGVFESAYDTALQNGTLDMGMETVKADKIEVLDDQVVKTDSSSGAETHYIQAKLSRKPVIIRDVTRLETLHEKFIGLYRTAEGKVRAVYRVADKTTSRGDVTRTYKMQSPTYTKFGTWQQDTLDQNATEIPRNEWAGAWTKEVNAQPEYDETTMHLLTGTLLPVWNLLPSEGSTKAVRLITSDGKQYLGREIGEKQIDATLTRLGAPGRTKVEYKASDLYDRVLKGETVRLYNDKIKLKRSRVNNEQRIEVLGDNLWYYRRIYPDMIYERIGYQDRWFIPTTDSGKNIIERLIKANPVEDVSADVENLISTDPNKQAIKSQATSINSAKLPALYSRVQFTPGTINLDIGGGRFDNATEHLAQQGVTSYIYDPYNRTEDHNRVSASATQEGQSDTVTVSNVLNVIREQSARDEVYLNAVDALKENGTAYFTVYEGDGTGASAQTTKGWQENRLTSSYLPEVRKYFRDVSIKNKVIIAKSPQKSKIENLASTSQMLNTGGVASWQADRAGTDRTVVGIDAILRKARQKFGLPITSGHIRGSQIRGQYSQQSVSIRTKIANDLPAASHEIGHYLNAKYKLLREMNLDAKNELLRGLDPQIKAAFQDNPNQMLSEAFAEYLRKYLQNRETAQIDFPGATLHMKNTLDADTLNTIDELADDVNAYYSLGANTAQAEIMTRKESARDHSALRDKLAGFKDRMYLAWVDANVGIRKFDKAAGSNAYKFASNSAYSEAVSGQAIVGELRDMEGNVVSDGLQAALTGVNVGDKKEYAAFGEYLIVKHGPERLKQGMRVFANDMKNSTAWMERRQATLEQEYPEFSDASERLYAYQDAFLKAWGVDTGLVSAEAVKAWSKRWKNYVPFSRVMDGDASAVGAKRGYANQDSTIRKARGSGRSFIHPVDNIITNVTRMVNAAMRNRVMVEMVNATEGVEGLGRFMEPVPAPLKRTTIDLAPIKEKLMDSAAEAGTENMDAFMELIQNFDDVAFQYEQGKARGDVVTVLRGGKQEFYKVNDSLLLQSLVNMSPKQSNSVMDSFGRITRFITSNITGRNVVWSIFSNLPRDIGTYMAYSKDKNPIHLIGGMADAYLNKFKGKNASPIYKEYLAMGGGKTSAYTADENLQKNVLKQFTGDKTHWLNPLEWLDFVSDMVESGPRFATYKIMRERYNMNPQDAFYESSDITVNFRRGGVVSRQLNKIIPFFNASVQGVDKFNRWISAEDVSSEQRKKTSAIRATSFMVASLAIAALVHGINSGDDEKKKQYSQLSTYTKNGFFCIPIGDGKYFAIPKPREIASLSSLFERMLEYYKNGNDEAFKGFYAYAAETMLPNVVSGLAQLDVNDALSSLGVFGVFNAINSNKDFLGRPIESMSLSMMEPKDRFTQRTSKAAKAIGELLNVSPVMTDYAMQNLFGGFWKWNQALFPIGDQYIDYTLGVKRNYIKDSQYSNDISDDLYENLKLAENAYNSDTKNGDKALAYKLLYVGTNFYSNYQKLARSEPETDETRAKRQTVLDMLTGLNEMAAQGVFTVEGKALADFITKAGVTEQYPTAIDPKVKDASGMVHTLTSGQYVDYTTDYLGRYWRYVSTALSNPSLASEEGLKSAKNQARAEANAFILGQIGAGSDDAAKIERMESAGITPKQQLEFTAMKATANADGSFTKDELLDILNEMSLKDEQRKVLYAEGNPNATITSNPYTPLDELNKYLLTADPEKAKASVTGTYKELVVDSYVSGDMEEYNQLLDKLMALEVYDKKGNPYYTDKLIDGWIDAYFGK